MSTKNGKVKMNDGQMAGRGARRTSRGRVGAKNVSGGGCFPSRLAGFDAPDLGSVLCFQSSSSLSCSSGSMAAVSTSSAASSLLPSSISSSTSSTPASAACA